MKDLLKPEAPEATPEPSKIENQFKDLELLNNYFVKKGILKFSNSIELYFDFEKLVRELKLKIKENE